MPQKKKFKFQRTSSATAEHCCVPLCHASAKYNKVLSFHTFPSDAETRRKWIVAIRRENFPVSPRTRVCSRHFKKEDVREPGSETGRRLLKKGAVPALFEWNHFSLPRSAAGVCEGTERLEEDNVPGEEADTKPEEPDYALALDPLPADGQQQQQKKGVVNAGNDKLIVFHNACMSEEVNEPPDVAGAMSVTSVKTEADPVDISSTPHPKAEGKQLKKPLTSLLLAPQILSGLGQYVCSVCGDTFASLAQLARHVQFHDRDRPFPCAVCGKRFLSRSHHDEHQRVHTGERPFPCDRCERSFTTHHNRKRHQLIHDKEEAYRCTVCGVLFCQDHQLGNLSGIIRVLKQHENTTTGRLIGINTKIKLETNSTSEQEENVKKKKKHQHSHFEEEYSHSAEEEDSRMSFHTDVLQVPKNSEAHLPEALQKATPRIKKIAYDMEFTL